MPRNASYHLALSVSLSLALCFFLLNVSCSSERGLSARDNTSHAFSGYRVSAMKFALMAPGVAGSTTLLPVSGCYA